MGLVENSGVAMEDRHRGWVTVEAALCHRQSLIVNRGHLLRCEKWVASLGNNYIYCCF
jgi:hypothetical protein